MGRLLNLAAVLACVVVSWSPARGALLLEDGDFGPESLLRDTDTGLKWLRLTHSTNIPYNDMVVALQPGGAYESFRYATPDEVATLWYTSAGIDRFHQPRTDPPHVQSLLDLMTLIGVTQVIGQEGDAFYRRMSSGVFDVPSASGRLIGEIAVDMNRDAYTSNYIEVAAGYVTDAFPSAAGHFLVLVPEPASAALVSLGLACVARRRR